VTLPLKPTVVVSPGPPAGSDHPPPQRRSPGR
jgi:hypothetical protein